MSNQLNERELYKLVKDYYGYKANMLWCNSEKKKWVVYYMILFCLPAM